ncbi:MAG: hypothetical protein ACKOVA_01925 [Novosphingobium sp.]
MEQRKIQFVDRLRDRGFIDQWAFIIFASLGFAGIVSSKWLGLQTEWIAIGAVALMLIYALVVGLSGTGRVRADQAGDNCYYLGLIYTLASLSYAIATFDPNDTASTIVQGFGVALATTIFGLILRVFFNQGRPDLENVEEQARLELTEASTRLKSELREVVRQMQSFSVGLQQSLRETHQAATNSMEAFTKTSVDGLNSVVETANEAIRSEANDFAARSKRYEASFSKLLTKLDEHSDSLDAISIAHNQLREAAQLTQAAVRITSNSLEGFAEVARATGTAAAGARDASVAASESAGQMRDALGQVEAGLRQVVDETERQLEALRKGPGETVAAGLTALEQTTERLGNNLSRISAAHSELADNLSKQAKAALTATQQHTRALDAELQKSREATTRVHGSLAEMTDTLARHVEGRA